MCIFNALKGISNHIDFESEFVFSNYIVFLHKRYKCIGIIKKFLSGSHKGLIFLSNLEQSRLSTLIKVLQGQSILEQTLQSLLKCSTPRWSYRYIGTFQWLSWYRNHFSITSYCGAISLLIVIQRPVLCLKYDAIY